MIARHFTRFFYTKSSSWAAEKSQLATLRKKTGYTFANCKKALELHNNDLTKAEGWLKEQAQALGWLKATKLEGRQTSQGLVAVAIENNNAALVELNCETDFVARNETFKSMAEMAAKTCLSYAQKIGNNDRVANIGLSSDQLKELKASDGKSLADHVALMIGTVGENATLKRATCVKANDNHLHVYGYAHPSGNEMNSVLLGRLCGVVVLEQIQIVDDVDLNKLGKDLCQHVVGMDPKKIGSEDDTPAKNIDDEECLIYQEYINDDTILVKDLLEETGVKVVDFKRLECGEASKPVVDPLDTLETCQ